MQALLNCYSSYSLLSSTNKIQDLVQLAKQEGYEAIALTDYDYLYGYPEFDQACHAEGIKPLFGLTFTYSQSDQNYSLILLAKDIQGYQDILTLSSLKSQNDKFSLTDALPYLKNVYILHPFEQGEFYQLIQQNKIQELEIFINKFQSYDGFVTISPQISERLLKIVLMFQAKYKFPLVASQQIKYLTKNDYVPYKVLNSIKNEEKFLFKILKRLKKIK